MLETHAERPRSATPLRQAEAKGVTRTLPVDGKSVPDAYLRRLELAGDDRIFLAKRDGVYQPTTWKEAHATILGVFSALAALGVQKGDRVCILSQSRPEWILCDWAIQALGAVTVPLYHSSSSEDSAYILEHCEAKAIFAEDPAQCAKLRQAFLAQGRSLPVIAFQDAGEVKGLEAVPFASFAASAPAGADETFRKAVARIQPSDVASIVYTSGTTGTPKGAVLTHSNFTSELRSIVQSIELHKEDLTLTFLPFAHILARVESLITIFAGVTLGFAENVNTVVQNLQEVKPTLLVSVPRIYEKIYTKIQSEVESSPEMKRRVFKWAVGVGREVARRLSEKQPISLALSVKFKIADQIVFSKVRGKLGGRVRLSISGGAPLSPELCEFLHACGVKVMEGYGLTETAAAITCNRPDDYTFGSVGKPVADTELRIAADGEIQARGSLIFKEYFKNPEATAEVFTPDGWFTTGDIGEIDSRGFLRITDRKKELIVTSGGKKVAPQKLENLIKQSRFLSNGMVYGDKQKYLVALLTLNEAEIAKWAKEQGVAFSTVEDLAKHAKVEAVVEAEMKGINAQLASFETIKKFKLLPRDFTIESGELTPSLKLKRKVCTERYKEQIQQLYA